jgi:hypothetical protein
VSLIAKKIIKNEFYMSKKEKEFSLEFIKLKQKIVSG